MRNVYVSFLGTGKYESTPYYLDSPARGSHNSRFVQAAELELLAQSGTKMDRVLILGTEQSWEKHKSEMFQVLAPFQPEFVTIKQGFTPEENWEIFEALLQRVESGDHLWLDITHGFRSIPVIFSAALHFLRLIREVTLEAVYYGVFNKEPVPPNQGEIVDLKGFYQINDWSVAVNALVKQADARPLVEMSGKNSLVGRLAFEEPAFARAMEALTDAVRHVMLHEVKRRAEAVLAKIEGARAVEGLVNQALLDRIESQFAGLLSATPHSGRYDRAYFDTQAALVEVMLKHGMVMQAYTAMVEWMGSIGLIRDDKADVQSENRVPRREEADVFKVMVEFSKKKWNFKGANAERMLALRPWYDVLDANGVIAGLHALAAEMKPVRNGFAHGWTGKSAPTDDLANGARAHFEQLQTLTERALQLG